MPETTHDLTDAEIQSLIAHLMHRCNDECPHCELEFEELYRDLGGEGGAA